MNNDVTVSHFWRCLEACNLLSQGEGFAQVTQNESIFITFFKQPRVQVCVADIFFLFSATGFGKQRYSVNEQML